MAYCPNCNAELAATAAECPNCHAVFGEGSSWRPTDARTGEFVSRRTQTETTDTAPRRSGLDWRLLGSPWVIIFCALVFCAGAIYVTRGWALWLLFVPHYALPVVFVVAVLVYAALEVLGNILREFGRLNFPNYLAACAVLGFLLGFLPSRPDGTWTHRLPLLEDYAASLAFYTSLLYLVAVVWWLSSKDKARPGGPQRSRYRALAVPGAVILAPYLLLAVAQTSRLHDAVASRDLERVARALKPWTSLDGLNRRGDTPLSIAIDNNDLPIAKLLLERGASIQLKTQDGGRVDHVVKALQARRPEMVRLLLDHGAKLERGEALQVAVQGADLALIALLLEHGAPASSAIFNAVSLSPKVVSRYEIVQLLLRHGADIRATARDGRTLLSGTLHALPQSDLQMIEFLVQNGYPLNERREHGQTPLYQAARAKRVEAVRLLLQYGADPSDGGTECLDQLKCTPGPRTALHEAATWKYAPVGQVMGGDVVDLLIGRGAKVNVVDPSGETPLVAAIASDNLLATERLLAAGANPHLGRFPRRPIDLARQKEDGRFMAILTKHGVKEE